MRPLILTIVLGGLLLPLQAQKPKNPSKTYAKDPFMAKGYDKNSFERVVHPVVRLGTSVTKFHGADFDREGSEYEFAPTAGLGVNFAMSDYFWTKHDVFFVRKATKNALGDTYQHDYIDIYPFSLTYVYYDAHFFLGPQIGYLIGVRDRVGGELTTDRALYHPLDYGGVAGMEINFPYGLVLGARYVRSFGYARISPRENIHHKAFLITLGWTLR